MKEKVQNGNLVQKKVFITYEEISSCLLGLNWKSPYTIIEVVRSETYKLVGEDDKPIKHPWNSIYLRKYNQWMQTKKTIDHLLQNLNKVDWVFIIL